MAQYLEQYCRVCELILKLFFRSVPCLGIVVLLSTWSSVQMGECKDTCTLFLCPATKVAGYYVIPSDILSVCLSVRQRFILHVRSIT